ncbi:MAG: hypothetical protein WAN46_09070 [Gammaproteobacteria bacterium]
MTAAVAIQDRKIFPAQPYSTGTSETSRRLQKIFESNIADLSRAVTWDPLGKSRASLDEIYHECAESNWDGYGALPVAEPAYDEAVRFLAALPSWLPIPELVPEPSGEIGFEWNFGKNRVFAASVNGTNLITYAGLLGKGNKAHGTEVFDGSIPQTLINHIVRICP